MKQTILHRYAGSYPDVYGDFQGEWSFMDIFNAIRRSESISQKISHLRNLKKTSQQEEARKFKLEIPSVTFSAIAEEGRKPEFITQYNSVVLLDFDHIPDNQFQSTRKAIEEDDHTACVFTSPSGDGLKVLVMVNSILEDHKLAFRQVADYFECITGLELDKSGSDPLRLCILSFDPDIYINESSTVFAVDLQKDSIKTKKTSHLRITDGNSKQLLQFILDQTNNEESYQDGNRNNFIHFFACNLNRGGIQFDVALGFCVGQFSDCSRAEIASIVKGVYNRNANEFGTKDYEVQMLTKSNNEETDLDTATIPEDVYQNLPVFFRNQCDLFKDQRERDVFFISFLGIVSGCLNRIFGIYRGRRVHPNLFIYVVAPAGSNKGVMEFARMVGAKYHKNLLELNKVAESEHQRSLDQYQLDKKNGIIGDIPEKPMGKRFFISGNSSASALLRQLKENDCTGVVCESEGDTIGNMLKQDWGNYSEILRKAFHHEQISINRKDREECHDIDNVKLSVVITSTPDQVGSIIQSAENGLFSRFLFYLFATPPDWVDMDLNEDEFSMSDHFSAVGSVLVNLIQHFENHDTKFRLQDQHKDMINNFGRRWIKEVATFVDEEATAVVKRFGLILFRLCMIFTAVRHFDDGVPFQQELTCNDQDARSALIITETLIQHALVMFNRLPRNEKSAINGQMKIFYDLLPDEFPRKSAITTAGRLDLKTPTVDKYLSRLQKNGFLVQPKYGFYEKTNRINCINRINCDT